MALNIQRGRDHGLPGYIAYRDLAAKELKSLNSKIKVSDNLDIAMGKEQAERIRKAYEHLEDVDLFSGGLSEKSVPGGLVGPTFGYIIAKQFQELRRCDRFWYETPDQKLGFTERQLAEIKKSTLAGIICRNCDRPDLIQKQAFDMADPVTNPLLECSQIPDINLAFLKDDLSDDVAETWGCEIYGRVIRLGQKKRVGACQECQCSTSGKKY